MDHLAELSHDPDPTVAASTALDKLDVRGEARRLLTPAVVDYFRRRSRGRVHAIEREAAAMRGADAVTAVKLLREGFPLPGRFVRWGAATVADHEERIALLSDRARLSVPATAVLA